MLPNHPQITKDKHENKISNQFISIGKSDFGEEKCIILNGTVRPFSYLCRNYMLGDALLYLQLATVIREYLGLNDEFECHLTLTCKNLIPNFQPPDILHLFVPRFLTDRNASHGDRIVIEFRQLISQLHFE